MRDSRHKVNALHIVARQYRPFALLCFCEQYRDIGINLTVISDSMKICELADVQKDILIVRRNGILEAHITHLLTDSAEARSGASVVGIQAAEPRRASEYMQTMLTKHRKHLIFSFS